MIREMFLFSVRRVKNKFFGYPRLVFGLLILIAPIFGFSQNPGRGWKVIRYGDYDPALFEQALRGASLDAYRKLSTAEYLDFENGARVELSSAQSLLDAHVPVDLSVVKADDFVYKGRRTFGLHSSGILLEHVIPVYKEDYLNPALQPGQKGGDR